MLDLPSDSTFDRVALTFLDTIFSCEPMCLYCIDIGAYNTGRISNSKALHRGSNGSLGGGFQKD